MCFSSSALSDTLRVLGTVGDIEPIGAFTDSVSSQVEMRSVEQISKDWLEKAKNVSYESMLYPLTPSSMSPGMVGNIKFVDQLSNQFRPLAIVGTDPLSKKWLKVRKDSLVKLNAPVFVVQANSNSEVIELRKSYPGLTIIPSSSDGMGSQLNLKHYPVLITKQGVWQ